MTYYLLEVVEKKLKKYKRTDKRIVDGARKQLKLFEENENHPSLRCHKLQGKLEGYWSISIGLGMRMLYYIRDGEAYFFDIGTHDEVYREN